MSLYQQNDSIAIEPVSITQSRQSADVLKSFPNLSLLPLWKRVVSILDRADTAVDILRNGIHPKSGLDFKYSSCLLETVHSMWLLFRHNKQRVLVANNKTIYVDTDEKMCKQALAGLKPGDIVTTPNGQSTV